MELKFVSGKEMRKLSAILFVIVSLVITKVHFKPSEYRFIKNCPRHQMELFGGDSIRARYKKLCSGFWMPRQDKAINFR